MVASMHLKRPPGFLNLTDKCTRLTIRGCVIRKIQRVFMDTADAQSSRHAVVTGTCRGLRGEPTMGARERLDGCARLLETLAEQRRCDA